LFCWESRSKNDATVAESDIGGCARDLNYDLKGKKVENLKKKSDPCLSWNPWIQSGDEGT